MFTPVGPATHTGEVRAILVNADRALAERQSLGIDGKDELWEGEWHFVDPPKRWHARLNSDLFRALAPVAEARGLSPYGDNTGIFAELENDWRVPDQAYARPDHEIDEGLTGAELVVGLLSPGDESHAKLPFYAGRGISEVLIVDEQRRFELYRLASGGYEPVPDGECEALGVRFATVEGPRLRATWDGGSADV
jgi:Uma2 family endonuclease